MLIGFNNDMDSVVVEVQTNMATAYFCSNDEIIGDVWLFNIGGTPELPPWKQGGEPPYQNSKDFCYPHNIKLPILESDFRAIFSEPEDPNQTVGIYFRGKLVGILADGWLPGKSSFAKEDSAVARKMSVQPDLPT